MLKTIKRTKQMRLDELIKYVRENKKTLFKNRVGITFSAKNNNEVTFYQHGELTLDNWISSVDLFTVEIEEEIDEDTEFEQGVVVLKYGAIITFSKSSFGYLKQRYAGQQFKIYVFIDGGLELIYKREEESIDA